MADVATGAQRTTPRWATLILGIFLLLEMLASFVVLVAIWPDVAKVPNVSIVSSNAQVTATTTTTSTTTPASTSTTRSSTTTTTTTTTPSTTPPGSIAVVPPQQTFEPINIFGYHWNDPSSEALYLIAVIVLAVLGATLHALISFSDFLGHRSFRGSWIWWYTLRAPTGAAIAVIMYLAIRGGLLSVSTSTTNLSPYGIGALAALAGLFSRRISQKLKQVVDVLFTTNDDDKVDTLTDGSDATLHLAPASLPVGTTQLSVQLHGGGLSSSAVVRIGAATRTITSLDATTAAVQLTAADVTTPGVVTLELLATADANTAQLFHLRVRPRVDTAHTTTAGAATVLNITGAGFDAAAATVKTGTTNLTVTTRTATSVVATWPANIPLAGAQVVVTNPGAAGGASDPFDVTT